VNRPPRGDIFRRNNVHLEMFMVTAQYAPNLTLRIKEGSTWINGKFVEYIGGNTLPLTVPVGGAKWVLISININGVVQITDGVVSLNPNTPPELGNDQMPLAMVFMEPTTVFISNDMIYDVRPVMDSYIIKDHNQLNERDAINSHPMSAITGLEDTLLDRVTELELSEAVADLARNDGTTASEFTFNMDFTGTPSTDMIIWVNRGNLMNVGIRWNETMDRFEYTNDGIQWNSLGFIGSVPDASDVLKGVTKLSVAPLDSQNPIAVGLNDPTYLDIDNKSNIGHTHVRADITDLTGPFTEIHDITQDMIDTRLIVLEKLPSSVVNLSFAGAPMQVETRSFTRVGMTITISEVLANTVNVGDTYQAQYWTLDF